jgi:hypothetical protein
MNDAKVLVRQKVRFKAFPTGLPGFMQATYCRIKDSLKRVGAGFLKSQP